MTTIYAEKWHEMHTRAPADRVTWAAFCHDCGDPVQVRRDRRTQAKVILAPWVSTDGVWQVDAEGFAYRPKYPVHAYVIHQCRGEKT